MIRSFRLGCLDIIPFYCISVDANREGAISRNDCSRSERAIAGFLVFAKQKNKPAASYSRTGDAAPPPGERKEKASAPRVPVIVRGRVPKVPPTRGTILAQRPKRRGASGLVSFSLSLGHAREEGHSARLSTHSRLRAERKPIIYPPPRTTAANPPRAYRGEAAGRIRVSTLRAGSCESQNGAGDAPKRSGGMPRRPKVERTSEAKWPQGAARGAIPLNSHRVKDDAERDRGDFE